MRSLGLNPTQEQLRDIITELRGEESLSGYVDYERFEKVMMRVLTEQQAGNLFFCLTCTDVNYWLRISKQHSSRAAFLSNAPSSSSVWSVP